MTSVEVRERRLCYRDLLEEAKQAAREVAVVSVLPRFDESWIMNAMILLINLWLGKICKYINASFIDGFSMLVYRPGFTSRNST